jgi:protein phosphatase 1 regulatory subunit 21
MNKNVNNSDNLDSISTNSSNLTENDHIVSSTTIDSNSISNPNNNTNNHLNIKYEKLVQDYVKLRSKLTILKKAYIELSETSSQKDQSMRKYEQEIEGLNFRNQQLTARVEILQKDLELANNSVAALNASINSTTTSSTNFNSSSSNDLHNNNKKHSTLLNSSQSLSSSSSLSTLSNNSNTNNTNNHSSRFEILAEELQHKINENTQLHRKLNEIEIDFGQKLTKNEQLIKKLEYDKMILEKKLESNEHTSKNLIEKLQNDKIKLELNLIQIENQLRETHSEKEKQESEFKKENQELKIQHQQFLHMSNSSSSLSSLGASSTPIKTNLNSPSSEDSLFEYFSIQTETLSKLFSSLEERSNQFRSNNNSQLAKQATKCDQLLNQKLIPLFKIHNTTKSFTDDAKTVLKEFFDFLHLVLQTCSNDLINKTDFQYANDSGFNFKQSDEMDTFNKKLKIYINKLDSLLFNNEESKGFSNSIEILIRNSTVNNNSYLNIPNISSQQSAKFSSQLLQMNDVLEKLLFVFNEKLALEYTLEYPTSLTTTDECILSYLSQFKQTNILILSLLNTNNISDLIDKYISKYHQKQDEISSRNIEYNNNILIEKEMDGLKLNISQKDDELKDLREKYEQLKEKTQKDFDEIERQNFRLEQVQSKYEDLKLKYEQQLIDLNELRSLRSESKNNDDGNTSDTSNNEISQSQMKNSISDDFANYNHFNIDDLEELTVGLYKNQIDELNERIHYLDGKCILYHDEMKSIYQRLKLQLDKNNLIENELNEIKDQLERTRSGYETQMSTMSDHLIEMTDRMSRQMEENEKLKHDLNMTLMNNGDNNKNTKSLSKTNSKKSAK